MPKPPRSQEAEAEQLALLFAIGELQTTLNKLIVKGAEAGLSIKLTKIKLAHAGQRIEMIETVHARRAKRPGV